MESILEEVLTRGGDVLCRGGDRGGPFQAVPKTDRLEPFPVLYPVDTCACCQWAGGGQAPLHALVTPDPLTDPPVCPYLLCFLVQGLTLSMISLPLLITTSATIISGVLLGPGHCIRPVYVNTVNSYIPVRQVEKLRHGEVH